MDISPVFEEGSYIFNIFETSNKSQAPFVIPEYNYQNEQRIKTFWDEKLNDENNEPLGLILNNHNFGTIDDHEQSINIQTRKPKFKKDEDLNSLGVIEEGNINSQDRKNAINEGIPIPIEEKENSKKEKEEIIESKNIDNIIPIKINNNILLDEDKNDKLYKIFNPKEISEEFKDIRGIINEVNLEKNKKELFYVSKKDKKKTKVKGKRKNDTDSYNKKIKERFLKSLRCVMNEKLKYANSEKQFDFLPQCFISNITKKKNKLILNVMLKEIMSTNFFEEYKEKNDIGNPANNKMLEKKRKCPDKIKYENKNKKSPDRAKYDKNKEVIKYLENNEDIKKIFNFDIIGNMTFSDLFYEYLESNEFEKDILALKNEKGENFEYIKEYISKAYDFINYFSK